MFEIVKPGININFIKLRRIAFTFSALVIGVGLLSLLCIPPPSQSPPGVLAELPANVQLVRVGLLP